MTKNCLFCKNYQIKKDIIFENRYFYSQFDRFPVSPGHTLVIPKRHVLSLLKLRKEEWYFLFFAINKTLKIIEKTNLYTLYSNFIKNPINEKSIWFCKKMLKNNNLKKKPDGYNFGNNDGEAAGRTIHHLHIHIIPRFFGDVKNPQGGIRQIIPNMGNYK